MTVAGLRQPHQMSNLNKLWYLVIVFFVRVFFSLFNHYEVVRVHIHIYINTKSHFSSQNFYNTDAVCSHSRYLAFA